MSLEDPGNGAATNGAEASSTAWPTFVPEEQPLPVAPLQPPDPFEPNLEGSVPSIAARLARFIWRSEPDARTVDLARKGQLATAQAVYDEAQRLLDDDRSHRGFLSFFGAWSEQSSVIGGRTLLSHLEADAGVNDFWELATEEYASFIGELLESESKLRDILLHPYELRSEALAAHLPTPVERFGILSQPLVLAVHSYEDRSSPSKRGGFVARRLLCRELPPLEHTLPGDLPEGEELRDWMSRITASEECDSCHGVIDPVGFALEEFDEVGGYRAEQNGHPVDASADLEALGLPAAVGHRELAVSLLQHRDVVPCLLSQWFTYALQRELTERDTPSWVSLIRGSEFYRTRDVPALIAATDAFRLD